MAVAPGVLGVSRVNVHALKVLDEDHNQVSPAVDQMCGKVLEP